MARAAPHVPRVAPAGGRRAILAAFGAAASGTLLPFLAGALALHIQRDLRIGDVAFGVAISVVFATGGLGVMPAGALVDRHGWRPGLRGAAIATLLGTLGIAALGRSFWLLVIFMFLGGLSQAQAGPAGSLAIVDQVDPRRQGVAFGLKQTAGPTMAMLSGLSIPLVAVTVGWRWAFVLGAIVPVVPLVAVGRGRPPQVEGEPARAPGRLRGALRVKSMGLFTVASAFGMASVGALTGFIVLTGVSHGLSESQAGILVTLSSMLGLGCRVGAGWLSDRLGSGGFPLAAGLLAIGAIGFALLGVGHPSVTVFGTVLAYCGGWGWTGLMQYGAVIAHPEAPASAASIVQAGMSVGGAVGPVSYGVLAARLGYGPSWLIVAGSTAVAAALVALGVARSRAHPDGTLTSRAARRA